MNQHKFATELLFCFIILAAAWFGCWSRSAFRIHFSSPRNSETQLFYAANGDFSEKNSRRETVVKGFGEIIFNVPNERFYRFDPAMESGVPLQIDWICIEKNFCRILLTPRDLERCMIQQLRKTGDGAYVSTGADPVILIDTRQLKDLKKWYLPPKNLCLLLLAAAGCSVILFCRNNRLSQLLQKYPNLKNGTYRYGVLACIFLLLTACGITGNPVGLIRNSGISEPVGEKLLLFRYNPIRTDDFIAHGSASAISNYNHAPRFPLINRNTGLSGRNMLFLHDWGAPVLHPAIVLKPAVWGFFFLDLRRSLAWYWFFPVFFGMAAFAFLLDTLFPENKWYLHFVIAAGAVFAPYSVVWSFWPINCAAGSLLAAALLIRAWRSCNAGEKIKPILLGSAAGWAFAAAGATLYFPHIHPVLTLCIFLLGAVFCGEKLYRKHLGMSAAVLLIFLLVAVGLLSLYLGAIREPLQAAMSSVYPGKRLLTGGTYSIAQLLRHNLFILNFENPLAFNNICESQRFSLLLPALLIALILYWKSVNRKAVLIGVSLFLAMALIYMLAGFPQLLGHLTLWNRIMDRRISFAIVLAQFIFAAALCVPAGSRTEKKGGIRIATALAGAAVLTALCSLGLGSELRQLASPSIIQFLLLDLMFFALCSFLLIWKTGWGIALFVGITVYFTVRFNPVCLAPTAIRSPLYEYVKGAADLRHEGRILFIDPDYAAAAQSAYTMAGGKTLTGFFCYEDPEIYRTILSRLPDPERFHRLNHLSARLNDAPNAPLLAAQIPQADVIALTFHSRKYDFSLLPVDFVCVNSEYDKGRLAKNRSLKEANTIGVWKLYRVEKDKNKK